MATAAPRKSKSKAPAKAPAPAPSNGDGRKSESAIAKRNAANLLNALEGKKSGRGRQSRKRDRLIDELVSGTKMVTKKVNGETEKVPQELSANDRLLHGYYLFQECGLTRDFLESKGVPFPDECTVPGLNEDAVNTVNAAYGYSKDTWLLVGWTGPVLTQEESAKAIAG